MRHPEATTKGLNQALDEREAAKIAHRARKRAQRNGRPLGKPGAFVVPEEMKREHRMIADIFSNGFALRATGRKLDADRCFERARVMQEKRRTKWYWLT